MPRVETWDSFPHLCPVCGGHATGLRSAGTVLAQIRPDVFASTGAQSVEPCGHAVTTEMEWPGITRVTAAVQP